MRRSSFHKDLQYYKFCAYGFLKNLRFFEPFLYLFFLEKGLTYLQIGTLITIREVLRNVLEIPTGMLSDILGRRRTMIGSFLFYILSFLVFYLTASYGLFVAAMLFYAVGDAFRTGTHKAMIFEYLRIHGWEDAKVEYYGHTRSWSQAGSAVSSLLAAGIIFYSGSYSSVFLFSAVPYFFDLILMVTYPSVLDGEVQKGSWQTVMRSFRDITGSMIASLRNRFTVKALSNIALYSGFFRVVKDYYQPVLATLAAGLAVEVQGVGQKQMSALLIGGMYFILYLGTSRASGSAGKISARASGLPAFLNASLLAGLSLVLLTGVFYLFRPPWYWLVVIPFTMVYLLENVRRPVGVACVSEIFPSHILATVLSTESQVRSLFAAVLAPVTGFLIDKYGVGDGLIIISLFLLMFYPLVKLGERQLKKNRDQD